MDFFTAEMIQKTLANYEKREAEITRVLASAEKGPKRLYRLLLREYTRERAQMNMRRQLFARWKWID